MYIRFMASPPRKTCFLFYKPYGVVSRFTPEGAWLSLKTFGPFKPGAYPVGRLDADSEGLLFLTDDTFLTHRLTDPAFDHPKTYVVQVERIPGPEALARLREGVVIEGRLTKPAEARLIEEEPDLPAATDPYPIPQECPDGVDRTGPARGEEPSGEENDRCCWTSDAPVDPYPCRGIHAGRTGTRTVQGIESGRVPAIAALGREGVILPACPGGVNAAGARTDNGMTVSGGVRPYWAGV